MRRVKMEVESDRGHVITLIIDSEGTVNSGEFESIPPDELAKAIGVVKAVIDGMGPIARWCNKFERLTGRTVLCAVTRKPEIDK